MVDETTTADQLGSTPHPWEYRAQPTWKRLPIITGGVLVNFIGALIIYSAVFHHWGQDYMPLESATYGLHFSDVMLSEGFVQGDKIIRIGDRVPDSRADLVNWMVIDGVHDVQVLRGNDTVNLTLSDGFERKILADQGTMFCDFRFPFVVQDLIPEGPAAKALMMAGDSVIGIGGKPMNIYQDIVAELPQHAMDSVDITFVRAGETHTARVFLGDEAKLGVYMKMPDAFLAVKHVDYSFWEAIPAGIRYGWETLGNYVKQFRLVFTKEGAQSLGGFATIGSLFAPVWNWHSFWLMTAFLSIILAFMNIIPIPGLDGGHVFFVLWEMITGKKPNDKFLEIANNIGFYLLLALLIYANGNDILKIFLK
jgi:regulator of sigma E protease